MKLHVGSRIFDVKVVLSFLQKLLRPKMQRSNINCKREMCAQRYIKLLAEVEGAMTGTQVVAFQ